MAPEVEEFDGDETIICVLDCPENRAKYGLPPSATSARVTLSIEDAMAHGASRALVFLLSEADMRL
jgi:hypothetical protein